jgi:hypothetical protein
LYPPFSQSAGVLALKFVEERELSAGDVLQLFSEAADAVELSDCGDERILVFRHGFGQAEKKGSFSPPVFSPSSIPNWKEPSIAFQE